MLLLIFNFGEKLESICLVNLVYLINIFVIVLSRNVISILGKLVDIILINDDSEEN